MTRTEFIKLVKDDIRAQSRQVFGLMILVAIFGGVACWIAKRHEGDLFAANMPYLWILLGVAVLFCVVTVAWLRLSGRQLLRCPHCHNCIGGLSAQVVVAAGRCGYCGGQILDNP